MKASTIILTLLFNAATGAYSMGHLRPVSVVHKPVFHEGGAFHLVHGEEVVESAPAEGKCVPMKEHLKALDEKRSHGHHLFASLLLCMIVSINVSFAMVASSNKTLVKNAWGAIGAVSVVLIATSLYSVAAHIFEDLTAGIKHFQTALHILWALLLFFVAVFVSYKLRHKTEHLAAFNAVIFWVCLLAKGGAFNQTQDKMGQSFNDVLGITFGGLVFFAILMVISHRLKPEPLWYDDVETGLAGGAFAGGFVTLVDMCIRGHDHDKGVKEGENPWANYEHAMLTNLFALATVVAAVFLSPLINKWKKSSTSKGNYWLGRFWGFMGSFIGILPYFTVSFGMGAMVANGLGVHPDSMMAKLTHTMTGTVLGAVIILVCAFTPYLNRDDEDIVSLKNLMLGFGGFIAGAGWANLIVASMKEAMSGRGYTEHEAAQRGMFLIVLLNALFIPIYVGFLQPTIDSK